MTSLFFAESKRWSRSSAAALAAAVWLALPAATLAASAASTAPATAPPPPATDTVMTDPYLWLEDVDSPRALEWARARNAETHAAIETRADYAPAYARVLEVYNSRDRIPEVVRHGDWLYNFWQDDSHRRGILRRATLAQYRQASVPWETVIDLDALGAAEHENWTWQGMECLGPAYRHCLVSLSRGGADAAVVREFDSVDKRFVDAGFALPEAKSSLNWIDVDNVYVGTDFGPGSMTDSGYPRIVKRWHRGTPLADAVTIFEGDRRDVSVSVSVDRTPGFERTVLQRSTDFWNSKRFLLRGEVPTALDVPDDAVVSFVRGTLMLELRSPLTLGDSTYTAGSLLAADADAWLSGRRQATALFAPTPTRSLASWAPTRDHIVLDVLDHVASRLEEWTRTPGGFTRREVKAPFPGRIGIAALYDPLVDGVPAEAGRPTHVASSDASLAESYLFSYVDFLRPDSLALATAGSDVREPLKARPPLFDATGMHTEQFFATSKDGTRVPYFMVWPKGMSSAAHPGDVPTLLYGYGGFEISMQPFYSGAYGAEWYSRGGVLVVANIRGGGEFGPAWHQAAMKAGKQKSYDDFIAVAEDLVARGITSPKHLGIQGGSNGGLLVGAVMVQRPDLFNAVVCEQPLLDMKRYSKLLAGASWMGEYGDPDVDADWAFISRYSPYQNIRPGVKYSPVLFTTSTRDDRVHPGHARKMAARMIELGNDVLFYENIEGGHAGAADNAQRAHLSALIFTYLWRQLGG
jgi:prolyl oligopeptidase